jgi:iron complex outermembrane receptor protein
LTDVKYQSRLGKYIDIFASLNEGSAVGPVKSTFKTILACLLLAALSSISPAFVLAAENVLEEVIVSAQKREQNLQEVSIAITAFDAEQIRNLSVINLEEITQYVSGVELFDDRGAGQPTWVIRGVGLADFNSNNTPTAAIYYDEFYLTSNVLGGIGLFDIERIEILKGPQGGLYGRNTSGGAVRVLSKRPSLDEGANGFVTAAYGSWGRYGFEGALGAALSDTVAIRIAAMTDQGGGWQDSLITPEDDKYGDRDFSAVRAQLLFEPSDSFDLLLKVEGGKDESETTLAYTRALFDPFTGDFCASAQAGRHDETNCIAWGNITNLFALTPGDPGLLPSLQDKDGSVVLSKPINALDNSWTNFNLQLNWELGAATLTSITGYLDFEQNQIYDFDGQPLTLFEEDGSADIKAWSQEFRLVSNSDGPLSWLAGAMYAEDSNDELRIGDLSENVLIFPTFGLRGFNQETESWAVFGQLEYQLSENWRLNGSLRYTDEQKDMNDAFFEDIANGFFYFQGVNKSVDLKEHWSGHIGVDWMPTDDSMIYARITQGFKSGGFFGGFAFTPEELDPYQEEIVVSYEIGFKSTWLDQTLRLNGAAYYYDYQDVQGYTQVLNEVTQTVVTKLDNLGDATHKGAELDLYWLPASAPGFSLQFALSWLDAKISDSNTIALDQAGMPVPIEGLNRSFAPEWSTSLQLRYEWNFADSLLGAAQVNYSWRDDIVDKNSSLSAINLAGFSHESYGLLNARFSIGSDDDRWNVALVGKNLTNEHYWARASGDDLLNFPSTPARPRRYGIEGTYRW